jgi:predicted nucleotidyltransferase
MIHSWLLDIEQEYDIEILLAVETGSQVWGGATAESDHDIRFIFKHRDVRTYLSLKKALETLSFPAPYDAHGWDVFKAFHLLDKSNPSLLEWVCSPVIYMDRYDFSNTLLRFMEESYSLFALYQHYIGLMKRNVKEVWQKEFTEKRQKQLIQGVRSFLLAREILAEGKIPRHALYTSFERGNLDKGRVVHIYHQLMEAKSNSGVLQDNLVYEVIAIMEKEKASMDASALSLSPGKRMTGKLDKWLWELLEVTI